MAEETIDIDLVINTANSAKTIGETRKALKDLRTAALQVEEGSEAFTKITQAAGELQDKVGDLNQRIKFFASDTKNLDGAIATVQGLAGAFSLAQGAMALVGSENEDLQKTLLKVQGSMAVLNGLQEVSNALNKDSAASIFLNNTASKLAATGQRLYATAIGTSTGALKAFKTALVATGIGAAIVAVGLLVANWEKLSQALGLAGESQEEVKKKLEETKKALEEQREAVEKYLKSSQSFINRNIEIIKLEEQIKDLNIDRVKNSKEIFEIEQNILELKLQQLRVELETKRGLLTLEEELKIKSEIYRLEQEQARARQVFAKEESERQKKRLEELNRLNKQLIDERIKAFVDGEEKEIAVLREAARTRLAEIKGNSIVEKELRIAIAENLEKDLAGVRAKYKDIEEKERAEKEAKKKEELEKLRSAQTDYEKYITELAKAQAAERKAIRDAEFQAAVDLTNSLSMLLNSFGENSAEFVAFQKTLSLIQIGLDTAKALGDLTVRANTAGTQAAIAAGAATGGIGAAPAAAAMSAATYVSGAAQILAAIAKAKAVLTQSNVPQAPRFARGGFVSGAGTGTSDSITAKLSNGESVLNANSTAQFGSLLSAINQAGGGVRFASGGVNNQDIEILKQINDNIANGNKREGIIRAVVTEKEITDSQSRRKRIETASRF